MNGFSSEYFEVSLLGDIVGLSTGPFAHGGHWKKYEGNNWKLMNQKGEGKGKNNESHWIQVRREQGEGR